MSHDLFQESVSECPQVSSDEALGVVRQRYGVEGDIRPLPSERDQNYLITPATGDSVVLKISNPATSAELLDAQNQAMQRVAGNIAPDRCAQPLPAEDGAQIARVEFDGGLTYQTRVVTYLPGVPWAKFRPNRPALLKRVGQMMGRVAQTLSRFEHPAADRVLRWDLARAESVVDLCRESLPTAAVGVVDDVRADYDRQVVPLIDSLRRSVIHGDANDYNVIVDCDHASLEPRLGLIDFGDMVQSHTINELAILLAYVMMGSDDPIGSAVHVVGGFHEQLALTEDEVSILESLARMRMATSISLAYRQSQAWDQNGDYLTVSLRPALNCLERLSGQSRQLTHMRFRQACGWNPCPRAFHAVQWVHENREQLRPVLPWDLGHERVAGLDLSVGSLDYDAVELQHPRDDVLEQVRKAGCRVGVGRYNEPRMCYRGDQFSPAMGAARTIHIGIDLFAPAGTPVHAPLAGTVHSLADNDQPFDYGPTVILEHAVADDVVFYTLYGHLSRETLKGLTEGQRLAAGQSLGTLGARDENGGWPPHLHFQWICDDLGYRGDFPGVVAAVDRETWNGICPDPSPLLGLDAARTTFVSEDVEELYERRRRVLGPSLSLSYQNPLHIVRGDGAYLFDNEGLNYLDLVNNVCHVGHCHRRVTRAACAQIPTLNTNTRYLHANILEYAERLKGRFPAPLEIIFLVNSGSEANDLALRMARQVTGREDVVVLDAAYHGNLMSLVDVSPYKFDGPGGSEPPAHVHVAPMPDPYRGMYRGATSESGRAYASEVAQLLKSMDAMERPIGAFLCESLLGCGGQIELPPGFLERVYGLVRSRGGVCIADEVQVGFGRVGTHFWGFETQNVIPDIVTMGKPIGNGHPLGAVITTRAIAEAFANGMEYFNTFGGNPVSAAVGLAVLDVIEEEELQQHANDVGDRLLQGLRDLARDFPAIGDVRGRGLFLGVELVCDQEERLPDAPLAGYVAERLRELGILISTDGPDHNVLKIKPPLAIVATDADRVVDTLRRVLLETAAG